MLVRVAAIQLPPVNQGFLCKGPNYIVLVPKKKKRKREREREIGL